MFFFRTLFCTQAFKYTETAPSFNNEAPYSYSKENQNGALNALVLDHVQQEKIFEIENSLSVDERLNNHINKSTQLQENSSPSQLTSLSSQLFKSNEKNILNSSNLEKMPASCKPCRAFDSDFHHYISYEKSNDSKRENQETSCTTKRICYISQSEPSDTEVFSLVRKACLRTLHCEGNGTI
jgi:hypothetical protein